MFEVLDEVCTPKRGTKYSAYVDLSDMIVLKYKRSSFLE